MRVLSMLLPVDALLSMVSFHAAFDALQPERVNVESLLVLQNFSTA